MSKLSISWDLHAEEEKVDSYELEYATWNLAFVPEMAKSLRWNSLGTGKKPPLILQPAFNLTKPFQIRIRAVRRKQPGFKNAIFRAFKDNDESDWAYFASQRLLDGTHLPGAVDNVAFQQHTSDQIKITWEAPDGSVPLGTEPASGQVVIAKYQMEYRYVNLDRDPAKVRSEAAGDSDWKSFKEAIDGAATEYIAGELFIDNEHLGLQIRVRAMSNHLAFGDWGVSPIRPMKDSIRAMFFAILRQFDGEQNNRPLTTQDYLQSLEIRDDRASQFTLKAKSDLLHQKVNAFREVRAKWAAGESIFTINIMRDPLKKINQLRADIRKHIRIAYQGHAQLIREAQRVRKHAQYATGLSELEKKTLARLLGDSLGNVLAEVTTAHAEYLAIPCNTGEVQ